jgi:NhaC family Na+:H+ antiporter
MATALGVSTFEYAPYAIFNYMMPVMVILLAFLGPTLSYMTVEQRAQLEETGTV